MSSPQPPSRFTELVRPPLVALILLFFGAISPPWHDAHAASPLGTAGEPGGERDGNPHVHPAPDGLMAWRASHYVVAGGLAVTGLLWAAHEAWSARRYVTARPLVVTEAYDDRADTLRARETLSDLLARAGITGRDYVAFLGATKALDARRLRPGLVFNVRRLRGDSVTQREQVRQRLEIGRAHV